MTSSLLISTSAASAVSPSAVERSSAEATTRKAEIGQPNVKNQAPGTAGKCPYQADQQAKFLHLQAEADALLQQLQLIKKQRQAAPPVEVDRSDLTQRVAVTV